jgi:hypothetical protein
MWVRAGIIVLACRVLLPAGERANVPRELQPRLFTFKGDKAAISDVLTALYEQTGNRVVDRRKNPGAAPITLAPTPLTFWQALHAVAQEAGAGISLYEPDGQIALVDRAPGKATALPKGLFRLAIKRTSVTRDDDANTHTCAVHLEVAWEPRFQPFYLEIGPQSGPIAATYAKDARGKALKVDLPGRAQIPVAGRIAVEDILRLPAPDRSSPRIDSLRGTCRVIGPVKMLTFSFDPLKPAALEQELVKVTLKQVTPSPSHWAVDILIENPAGGPTFESYQSWLDNNTIHLEKGNPLEKGYLTIAATSEMELETPKATRAAIRYHFSVKDPMTPRNRAPSGQPADWRLVYRTPGRIVAFSFPFEFKNVDLP